ncbi:hypothetical protein SRB5_14090 [Streptomyces sp. RB5]|uniref:Uncharacterized protein n=1 Tax=Streptomyces smaragdinus TaxID=2585196 RepID=A0A7K0CEV6_9ACTN|nr:hypothetical protein [Streptomyces smaragdinus]MQY11294.1 hypothetical protein [Streptomyces smaragdinus]
MLLVVEIVAALFLVQGIAPLIQEAAGKDPEQSFFIVNSFDDQQPFASIVLILLGACMLYGTVRTRRQRS